MQFQIHLFFAAAFGHVVRNSLEDGTKTNYRIQSCP